MHATCSHCQTVFKVSDENLKAAGGYVRCGICKKVFNALVKDLFEEEKEAVTPAKTTPPATTVKKTIESNDADPVEFILEKSNEVSTNKSQSGPSTNNKSSSQKTKITSPKQDVQGNLFKAPPETKKPKPVTASTETTQANIKKPEQLKPKIVPAIATKKISNITTPHAAKTENTKKQQTKTEASNLFDGVQSKLIPDEYRIPELRKTYSIWKDLAWSMAILTLTASLFIEYTWFNRNELIRNPQLRPLVTQFCILAKCGPMDLREPGEIEMTTRNIYAHPNVKNALMISGTLINHAQFEQPYPDILIDFSNIRGEVTASRIFTPEEYLQIKLSSLKPLAPNMSVDFTMEIQDPGKNAMTYEFSFL